MPHHRNKFLFGPVDQVFRARVPEALVRMPPCGPNKMEGAVRSPEQAGIPQEFARTDSRFEKCSGHIGPIVPIMAVQEAQAILAIITEGSEKVGGVGDCCFGSQRESSNNNHS